MQRYESYKPSGVRWLGDVPAHWDIFPFKGLFRMSTERNGKTVVGEMLSVSGYRGIEVKPYEFEEQKRTEAELRDYRVVRPGQLVVNTMWLNHTGLGVSEYEGHVSPAYRSYWFDPKLRARYVHYLMRSHSYVQGYTGQMQGIRPNSLQIKNSDFTKIPILVPPHDEQDRIVAFLDQKTAEIDAAIAKKERLIVTLIEQKQTLINQAVTTGLDQTVPRNYSGIEWIGDIPLGWEVIPITKYTKSIVDYRGKTPEKVAAGIFLVTAKNIKKGQIDYAASTEFVSEKDYPKIMARGLPQIDDLLFTTEAPLGEVALVDRTDVAFAQRIIKLRLKRDRLLPKFVVYAMAAGNFQAFLAREATGSTALGIKASKLHKLKIAAPSLEDQNWIVKYLDDAGAKIQVLLSHIHGEIENLCELKANTVASYVTGQLKV